MTGIVRITFPGMSTHPHVARLARVVRSQRPGIRLELSSQNFAQPAMQKLVRSETDIALGRWDLIPADVSSRIVMRDELVARGPCARGQRTGVRRRVGRGELRVVAAV